MKLSVSLRALVFTAGAALVPSFSAPAQVSLQFHFGEDDYHRIDSRHPMKGPQYQTMATLSHMLDETAQDLKRQAYRASRGDRTQMRLLASVSDFARRTGDFHNRMDGYLESPWDMRREIDDLARRARQVNGAIVNARVFPQTVDMWNSEIDILSRMQRVIRGENVPIPPVAVRSRDDRDRWDHRNLDDRDGDRSDDRRSDDHRSDDHRSDDHRPDSRDDNNNNNNNPNPR